MITPKFSITQDFEYIYIVIHAPHVKAQQVDILAEQNEFRFVVAPYFLRLNLPGNIIEDDRSTAKYDLSSGDFNIKIPKEMPGQFFEDLDLLSKLLARKSDTLNNDSKETGKSLIEVLSSTSTECPPSELLEDTELDWELPQQVHVETLNIGKVGYGFNGSYSGYFDHIQEMPNEINEIPNPETTSQSERRRIRIELENEKFDEDYYVGDLYAENEIEFQTVLKFKTPWAKILRDVQKGSYNSAIQNPVALYSGTPILSNTHPTLLNDRITSSISSKVLIHDLSEDSKALIPEDNSDASTQSRSKSESVLTTNLLEEKMNDLTMNCAMEIDDISSTDSIMPLEKKLHPLLEFTEKENSAMVGLPRKEFVLDKEESRAIYLGLVDLILSYSYELRVTQGEFSVESSWTIGKLCSTMACLEKFSSLKDVLVAHRRRVLSYPLYRHFELGEKIVRDTQIIFKLGRRALLKTLLQLKDLFDHHDVHYRYSKIILDDYCLWIQTTARDEILRSLSIQIQATVITPENLSWDLDELNALAKDVPTEK